MFLFFFLLFIFSPCFSFNLFPLFYQFLSPILGLAWVAGTSRHCFHLTGQSCKRYFGRPWPYSLGGSHPLPPHPPPRFLCSLAIPPHISSLSLYGPLPSFPFSLSLSTSGPHMGPGLVVNLLHVSACPTNVDGAAPHMPKCDWSPLHHHHQPTTTTTFSTAITITTTTPPTTACRHTPHRSYLTSTFHVWPPVA